MASNSAKKRTNSKDCYCSGMVLKAKKAVPVLRRKIFTLLLALGTTTFVGCNDARAEDPFLRRTATVRVVEKVGPSVVNITTEFVQRQRPFRGAFGNSGFDRFFKDFFAPQRAKKVRSLGSGVVIDSEGHVITNEHVIARAQTIRVTLGDGREFEAVLVGADPNNDLAVLQLETDESVPWTTPGSSRDVLVGEPVIAIGNPFGLSNSVTTGVLSAMDRSIRADERVFHGFLQTDASINPGNSGGPLLNAEGHLIGINTAIYGNAQGIGFAIPIDAAKRVVDELISRGEIAPVWLGLELQDLNDDLLEILEVGEDATGVLISRIRDASPAQKAGLKRGELLTEFDGVPISSAREFYDLLVRATTGQTIRLKAGTNQSTRIVQVVTEQITDEQIDAMGLRRLGLQLEAETKGGFSVLEVKENSGAGRIGIEPGDIIVGINGERLADVSALRRAILALRGRSAALLVVVRGRGRYHLTIPLG